MTRAARLCGPSPVTCNGTDSPPIACQTQSPRACRSSTSSTVCSDATPPANVPVTHRMRPTGQKFDSSSAPFDRSTLPGTRPPRDMGLQGPLSRHFHSTAAQRSHTEAPSGCVRSQRKDARRAGWRAGGRSCPLTQACQSVDAQQGPSTRDDREVRGGPSHARGLRLASPWQPGVDRRVGRDQPVEVCTGCEPLNARVTAAGVAPNLSRACPSRLWGSEAMRAFRTGASTAGRRAISLRGCRPRVARCCRSRSSWRGCPGS